ncbi:class II aldolase/adducin family protein [Blastococcus jejuensis]|uniref:Class II aldolase/adducin family protein n=1 Tax=Blastococcus jejuensis TaxID=351224 RepID=A0ABP6P3V4_9ACTN
MVDRGASQEVVGIAETLLSREVLSRSLHGNISVRLPDGERLVMTGSSLVGLSEDDLATVDLDGQVLDGHMAPTEREIVLMHAAIYRERPDVTCIVHTHSPYATTFAVAGRPLPLVAESLARWGVTDPIPVARWAPRGSDDAVGFILDAVRTSDTTPAVLLESHGILAWGGSSNEALRRTIAIEENAQLAVLAQALGGPKELTPDMARAAVARKDAFSGTTGQR